MAHFAKLDNNNIVLEVHAVNNEMLKDDNDQEREELGYAFLVQWSGGYPFWKQTSYNGTFRKNYAGIGYVYDEQRDAFIAPQPYASWLLDEDTCRWMPPNPMPLDGAIYRWEESIQDWVLVSV